MTRIEWLGPVPASNYAPGRQGSPIVMIVDHWMAGSFESALARFMNPAAVVSAHYLIGQTGRIVQVVKDEDTAYHAGNWPTNLMAIGIEHEASPTVTPSDALYAASAWLHDKISGVHNIPLTVGDTVVPHRQIVPTQCPGTLDLDRIVEEAMAGVTGDDVKDLIREMLGSEEGANLVRDAILRQPNGYAARTLEPELKNLEAKIVVETLLQVKEEAKKPRALG